MRTAVSARLTNTGCAWHRSRPDTSGGAQDEREESDWHTRSVYDLISVVYHALQGAETYEQYAHDAQRQGDQELADYFRKTQQQCQQSAGEAQQLLASRLQGAAWGRGLAWAPVKAALRWGMRAASPDSKAECGSSTGVCSA